MDKDEIKTAGPRGRQGRTWGYVTQRTPPSPLSEDFVLWTFIARVYSPPDTITREVNAIWSQLGYYSSMFAVVSVLIACNESNSS
ncbi:unnamed protein product [Nippostrongylus brasiliensis]|uniref:Uncharacterized protein n=1 Tax=Nippostrongylus brasiliensis TaxID=27835 RepID=A0A0N4XU27_NIPBR|nr:unnamed protein product [Nippostrongylus brasiliensis]